MAEPNPNTPVHAATAELHRLVDESDIFTVVGDVHYERNWASFDIEPPAGDTSHPWTVALTTGAGDSIDD